jgi:hypothetical protein
MTQPKTFMAFRADPELASAMQKLHARDGISISEQMRRALTAWLTAKRVYTPKKEKKR